MTRRCAILLGFLFLLAAGCVHGRVSDGAFVSDDYGFSVSLPGPPYERIAPKDALAALTDPDTGVSFAVAVSPDPYRDMADQDKVLDYLARDLLFFLTKKEYRAFEDATLGGEPAKFITVTGVTDDTELIVSAYVARYDGAVYDILMWCPPAYFETGRPAFQVMAETFRFQRETGQ
jgi:hypothetical protein